MAQRVYDGRTSVWFVTTIADITAPTIAEIEAGTDLSCYVTKDGFAPNVSTNNVDSGVLCDDFDGQVPGTHGADLTLTMIRDDGASPGDVAWDLWVKNTEGYIVWLPFTDPEDGPAAGDPAEVWQGQMHQKSSANSATNTRQTFTAPFPAQTYESDAVVST